MPSDLLTIGLSGARAARAGLDVTAQNIANAGTAGYVRRTISLAELSSTSATGRLGDVSLSGVRLDRVVRNADPFRQAEVRRTGSDLARADAEMSGLENIESAIDQSRVYPSIVDFEGALQRLAGDPTDPSLRAGVVEAARTMAGTFNIASQSLDGAAAGMTFQAQAGVSEVNTLGAELARVNLRLSRAADSTSDQSTLLDQRDSLLQQISGYANIATTFAADGTVEVRLGGNSGPLLVQGGTNSPLAMTSAADGTLSFDVGGSSVALSGGALAGHALALGQVAAARTRLDAIADNVITAVNSAQTNGVALDGSAGQPLFSGTGAAGMTLALSDGALIATAPSGAGAGSRDPGNLDALRSALAASDPAAAMDGLLFDVSGTVASRKVTQSALGAIAGNARVALESQAGVDLDQEAANLLRFQQAFQASGKAMQIAASIFDTLLAIK